MKRVLISLIILISTITLIVIKENRNFKDKDAFEELLKWEDRSAYELSILKDPATGKIPGDARLKEIEAAKHIPSKTDILSRTDNLNVYTAAGPSNYGGRSRVVQYDVRYDGSANKVLMAGAVNGGIFKSIDGGNTWTWKASAGYNSVTTLAQDPRLGNNPITGRPYRDTWYAGTGEFFQSVGSSDGLFIPGYGMFISDDNGDSWSPLAFTRATGTVNNQDNIYDVINKIVIHPISGEVYISAFATIVKAQRIAQNPANNNSFELTTVFAPAINTSLSNRTQMSDIIIKNDGSKIFVAWHGQNNLTVPTIGGNFQGIWQSTTGNLNSWSKIADATIFPQWNTAGLYGRVVMALAPSNQNLLFALVQNQATSTSGLTLPEADFYKIDQTTATTVITKLTQNLPNGGITATYKGLQVQGGYDMSLAIKPDNHNVIIIAGTSAYRSTDGFSTNTNTQLIGGYNLNFTFPPTFPNAHPDIHFITFRPGSNTEMLMATDGGISKTTDMSATNVTYTSLNNNFQTYQYYDVAIDPTSGQNSFLGGTQDNSCAFRNGLSSTPNNHYSFMDYIGGDGCSVGISKVNNGNKFLFLSTQFGKIHRQKINSTTNALVGSTENITPVIFSLTLGSEFITKFYLDPDNTNDLYYAASEKLLFTSNATDASSSISWKHLVNASFFPGMNIRALATTRGAYNSNHNLYYSNSFGSLNRLTDPRNINAEFLYPTNITPPGNSGNIIDISVNPRNDDTILVVVSNYNVPSIWFTGNAKSFSPTWTQIEGNLADFSIRSCEIVLSPTGIEYYVGTSLGLYSTRNLNGTNTTWVKESVGTPLEYAVISSLAYRLSDNTLLVGTHGNGMFFTTVTGSTTATSNVVLNNKAFIKSISPTYTSGTINLLKGTLTNVKKMEISIYATNGQLVYGKLESYKDATININNLQACVYILRILSDDKKYLQVQKIVKQ